MCEETTNTNGINVQTNFTFSEDPYEFDVDKNGFPALTRENVKRIDFIIHNDSNYRPLDEESSDSISVFIRKFGRTTEVNNILQIVSFIDKLNSTHQSSEGPKGGGKGCIETAKYICSISNFYERLENGDPELVNEIAKKSIKDRYTFSFASKYCTYMSRALFEDNYCIFDKVICDILPYYAWVYLGKDYTKLHHTKPRKKSMQKDQSLSSEIQKVSSIKDTFGKKDKGDYRGYRNLIDRIRYSAKDLFKNDYLIPLKDFDHLLWYYFKGKNPNFRITNAVNLVGKESSRIL